MATLTIEKVKSLLKPCLEFLSSENDTYLFQTDTGEKYKLYKLEDKCRLDRYSIVFFIFEYFGKYKSCDVSNIQRYIINHDSTKSIVPVNVLEEILTDLCYSSILIFKENKYEKK